MKLFLDKESYLIDFVGIYFIIICGFFTVLKNMDIYYMYLILTLINSVIGLFAYFMSIVTLSTSEDKIYKNLARIFGIVSIANALFAVYVFDNSNYNTQDKELEITLVNLTIQVVLYTTFVYTYNLKNEKNIFNNVAHLITALIPILYISITWTNLIPNINNLIKNIICIACIIGYIYSYINIGKISGRFYNYKTVKNIKTIFVFRIATILFILIFGGIKFGVYGKPLTNINKFNCISIMNFSFIHVYLIYVISLRDIIKRPNRNLYCNLLEEKQKLCENIEELNKARFSEEYYKIIYEQLLKNMPSGLLISYNKKIMFANNKVLNLFNLASEEDVINKNISDLVQKEGKEKYINISNALYETKKESIIHTVFSYNNTAFEAEEIRFYEKIHEKIFQVSIINSIEDKIKLENAKKELEIRDIMEKTRNEVLSNISHEFKTPVNVIYSTVQMQDLNLQKQKYDKILEFNKIIKKNCSRLVRLINNFIESTKLDENKIKLNLKCVNIVSIVEDITISVVNFAKSKNINIIFDTEEEELYCDIDIDKMERIMLNILSNSIKYNKVNGEINVLVRDKGEDIFIEVKDSGIGIPKEKIDMIFNRYERMENENAAIKEGSGIGLSIVKKLVEALKGEIQIESELEKGTLVRLIFKKSANEVALDEIYEISENLEEKVNLEMSDIS